MTNPAFQRYIGIDYSGAETPDSSLKGLRVYEASCESLPVEIEPPPSPRKYWTRHGLAEWLTNQMSGSLPVLVGIDHSFSFPLRYFEVHHLEPDWPTFLDDFQKHWPTDREHTYVNFIRDGLMGNGNARTGNSRWRRITEGKSRRQVSLSLRRAGLGSQIDTCRTPLAALYAARTGDRIHFWPFDGWVIPSGRSLWSKCILRLWNKNFPVKGRTSDQHDAYVAAAWLRQADLDGSLDTFLKPEYADQRIPCRRD